MNAYLRIARPDHWIKNVLVLPGCATAWLLTPEPHDGFAARLALGLAATCLLSSANYVINEWLDRDFDRHHPEKRNRPSVQGAIGATGVAVEYTALAATGLALSFLLSGPFFVAAMALIAMGWVYNLRPLRSKDRIYVDVLSEAVNNPIRLLLGWFLVTSRYLPPSSLLIAYWMGGAYLMGIKRYAELRAIPDRTIAGRYRKSLGRYTEDTLIGSALFYAICASLFGGIFLVKYKIELLLLFPLLATLFVWYFHLARKPDSAAQHPERLHREPLFLLYAVVVGLVGMGLVLVDLPRLHLLLETTLLPLAP